jgi:hypothetical protein
MAAKKEFERCPFCNKPVKATAERCPHCGEELFEDVDDEEAYRVRQARERTPDPVIHWLVPVGRSGWSIAAGYLGLFSFIPVLGVACAVLAITFGVLGLRSSKKNPGLGGRGRAIFAIAVGGLSITLHFTFFLII